MGDLEILQWVALKQTCVCVKCECKVTSKSKVVPAHSLKECRQVAKIQLHWALYRRTVASWMHWLIAPRKGGPGTFNIKGYVGLRASLDVLERKQVCFLYLVLNPRWSSPQHIHYVWLLSQNQVGTVFWICLWNTLFNGILSAAETMQL
jgi:hypothetical protein